jgi:hypothetical protein
VVECNLAKVEVAGSNPVSRSTNYLISLRVTPEKVVCKVSAIFSGVFGSAILHFWECPAEILLSQGGILTLEHLYPSQVMTCSMDIMRCGRMGSLALRNRSSASSEAQLFIFKYKLRSQLARRRVAVRCITQNHCW